MSAPAAAPPEARRFSDYTILEPIGSGLRGTVFRARNAPGRLVALKVFNPGVGIDIEILRRFSPYSDGGISHPNLVPVEAAGKSEGKAFCSMALLAGDSLEEVLAEMRGARRLKPHLSPLGTGPDGKLRPGSIRHAVALLLNVAEGLGEAHRAGVMHGRLSPRNLILAPTGRLVVTDFGSEEGGGSARRIGGGASHDLRTLAYRAPEQIEPDQAIDARADVYALGAILYELLARRPPFVGRDPRKLQEAILAGTFSPPSQIEKKVTAEAEAVVLRAMAFDPEDRYPSAKEMADDLRRLLRLEATRAGAEVRVEPPEAATGTPAADAPATATPAAAVPVATVEAIASDATVAAESPRPSAPAPFVEPAQLKGATPAGAKDPAPPGQEVSAPGAVAPPVAPSTPEPPPAVEPEPRFGWIQAPLPVSMRGSVPGISPPALWVAEEIPAEEEADPDPVAAVEAARPAEAPEAPSLPATEAGPEADEPELEPEPTAAIAPAPEVRGARRARRVAACLSTLVILGALGGWTWITILLHETGERSRVRAAIFSTGLERLTKATFALFSDDSPAARSLVSQTRDLGIGDADLAALESALRSQAADPELSDLSHPRAALRREAVAALSRAVEAGERPASDLAFLKAALADGDRSVREASIAALARGGSSAPLLSSFPIGKDLPALEIDSPTFLALARALSDIADGPAEATLLEFGFEDFARLDEPVEEEGTEVVLPPNLRISLVPHEPRRFAAEWIRGRGRLRGGDLLALSRRLERGDPAVVPLAAEVIEALPAMGTREAKRALLDLAAPLHLTHGPRILDALESLGAAEELLAIARGALPAPLRALAARKAGESLSGAGKDEAARSRSSSLLTELLRRDPDPEVRRSALLALRGIGAASSAGVIVPALWDPALREEALGILEARPVSEALPVLVDLLRKGDGQLRSRAAEAIGASRDPAALVPLSALLFEDDPRVRAACIKALGEISPQRGLILAAGVLPPGSPELKDLALAAVRTPLDGTSAPALLALALKEALGVAGADASPLRLREARRSILREQLAGAPAAALHDLPPRIAPLFRSAR